MIKISTQKASAPIRVNLLALRESTPTVLYGFVEVLSAVGLGWNRVTGEDVSVRKMDVRIVARNAKSFRSPVGPPIAPDIDLARATASDIVIVTDLALSADFVPDGKWAQEVDWVRRQFGAGAVICSVCTGSVLLAEAGLLDGIEATTHWGATGIFQAWYPRVELRPERVLCPGGPEHRIVTSGGPGSWEDLALYLIARFCGEAEAVRMAKLFVLGDRSEGQLVFSAMGRPRGHDDAIVSDCQAWIAEHYAAPNPVTRMVARSRLPERTFKRRFKAATGYTPVEYVQALRIEEAKQLLERTNDPTDAVGNAVGYEDQAFFRRLFKRRTGVTPARYRQRVRRLFQ